MVGEAYPLSDPQHKERARPALFPMETELVYDVDYNPNDVLSDKGHEIAGKYIEYYQKLAAFVINFSGSYQELMQAHPHLEGHFTLEQYSTIREISQLFATLIETDKSEVKNEILAKLGILHQESQKYAKIHVQDWWSGPVNLEGNFLYSSTIIALVNTQLRQLNQKYADNEKQKQAALAIFYKKIDKLPHFAANNGPKSKEERTVVPDWNVDGMLSDLLGAFSVLDRLAEYGTHEEYQQYKKELALWVGRIRRSLVQDSHRNGQGETKLQEFNRRLLTEIHKYGQTYHYTGEKSDEAVRQKNEQVKKELLEKGLDKLLVSTPEYVVYMHRTHTDAAKEILATGLVTSGQIESTATMSSNDPNEAIAIFNQRHKGDNAVVILRVPRDLVEQINDPLFLQRRSMDSWRGDEEFTYVIPPSKIVGFITREDLELATNPHFGDTEYDRHAPQLKYRTKMY